MEYPTRRLIALAVFAALPGMPIQGRDRAQWANIQSLHPDQTVTLTQTSGPQIKGRFREFSESAITLQTPTGQISFQRADVRSVAIGSGLTRLRDKAIGLGVGTGIGALIATKTPFRDQNASALGACRPADFRRSHWCVA